MGRGCSQGVCRQLPGSARGLSHSPRAAEVSEPLIKLCARATAHLLVHYQVNKVMPPIGQDEGSAPCCRVWHFAQAEQQCADSFAGSGDANCHCIHLRAWGGHTVVVPFFRAQTCFPPIPTIPGAACSPLPALLVLPCSALLQIYVLLALN